MEDGLLFNQIELHEKIAFKSENGNYDVIFFESLDDLISKLNQLTSVFVVLDKTVEELYCISEKLMCDVPVYLFEAIETNKSLSQSEEICKFLIQNKANKQSTIVAIGGGITQDVAQFSAMVFHRGLNLVLVPTTLLGISDSCIGGKCCINVDSYKNQIGGFKSPKSILIYPKFVATLKQEDILGGYGEIAKLTFTHSKESFDAFSNYALTNRSYTDYLAKFIKLSLESKKIIIEQDEFEGDLRRILNFGHTFGHAFETLCSHQVNHGIAVAFGMQMANFISFKFGLISKSFYAEFSSKLDQIFPLKDLKNSFRFSGSKFLKIMANDKKSLGGYVNLILIKDYAELVIYNTKLDEKLECNIDDFYIQ